MSSYIVSTGLEVLYGGLQYLAPLTPIKSDDALLVVIDAIMHDAELFGYTVGAFDAQPIEDGPVAPLPRAQFSEETLDGLKARGITVEQVLEYLPAIIQFLKLFRRKSA